MQRAQWCRAQECRGCRAQCCRGARHKATGGAGLRVHRVQGCRKYIECRGAEGGVQGRGAGMQGL